MSVMPSIPAADRRWRELYEAEKERADEMETLLGQLGSGERVILPATREHAIKMYQAAVNLLGEPISSDNPPAPSPATPDAPPALARSDPT